MPVPVQGGASMFACGVPALVPARSSYGNGRECLRSSAGKLFATAALEFSHAPQFLNAHISLLHFTEVVHLLVELGLERLDFLDSVCYTIHNMKNIKNNKIVLSSGILLILLAIFAVGFV